ncbi:hypothetical protein BDR04DRAFT_1123299 [Suillus decipiens]|nr:hypothetical protein BDR04DRAFT_1123299 [Suillus decipiens]
MQSHDYVGVKLIIGQISHQHYIISTEKGQKGYSESLGESFWSDPAKFFEKGIFRNSAIRTYYYETIDSEKSDKEGGPDVDDKPVVTAAEREAVAHPTTALFYKKECNEWDVVQKLFKEEINDYDKAERLRKGLGDSIKHRMGHA